MNTYVLCLQEIDGTKFIVAGGKGANLGELSRIKGIRVPGGFCVTTEAYKRITANNPELNGLLDELTHIKAGERENINKIGSKIRSVIENIPIAADIAKEITAYL